MCIYKRLMFNSNKFKYMLTEEEDIISSMGILSTEEKLELIYEQAEEYLSYHQGEAIDDNVLNIDLENSQTVYIMKKDYIKDRECMTPVEIISVEIDTGWQGMTFFDENDKEYSINTIEEGIDDLLEQILSDLNDLLIAEGLRNI